ncbi:MAG TPA: DUF547 domain-containing protein [Thermoanaerobaculia bacterium]|nr:DUF547 domain-containing protein [Thermoanaerobaculia bacterium]
MGARRNIVSAISVAAALALAAPAAAAAPDYAPWAELLGRHYDPAKGMNYRALKARDKAALDRLRAQLAQVDVAALARPDQLAYWINLYNVSVVGIVVDNYPVESIRDLSTDPIIRLNVFKKDSVPVKGGKMSLNDIENEKVRAGFKDPRIHFAINCAAESCPPIRPEPYVGARIEQQLDDQARKFLAGPHGVRLEQDGDTLIVHTTKVMDWFGDDFEKWGGGRRAFLQKHLPPEKARRLQAAKKVELEFDDYSWRLNDSS